jgi:hypothetical protein
LSENTITGVELPKIDSDINIQMGGQAIDSSNTPMTYDGIGWTVRGYNLHRETGLIIFLDVLGMKGIWKRLPSIEVINRWNKVIRAFMDTLEERPPKGGHLFRVLSDTIIITIPTKLNDFAIRDTFNLLLLPFITSLKLRMLLRGTISYGTYSLSERLIIGEALDDAAYHHDKFNWIGIALSPTLSANKGINAQHKTSANDSFTYCQSIPHKETPYNGWVLNWPKFDSGGGCYSVLEQESHSNQDSEKYTNTFAFYQSIIKAS